MKPILKVCQYNWFHWFYVKSYKNSSLISSIEKEERSEKWNEVWLTRRDFCPFFKASCIVTYLMFSHCGGVIGLCKFEPAKQIACICSVLKRRGSTYRVIHLKLDFLDLIFLDRQKLLFRFINTMDSFFPKKAQFNCNDKFFYV